MSIRCEAWSAVFKRNILINSVFLMCQITDFNINLTSNLLILPSITVVPILSTEEHVNSKPSTETLHLMLIPPIQHWFYMILAKLSISYVVDDVILRKQLSKLTARTRCKALFWNHNPTKSTRTNWPIDIEIESIRCIQ